MKSLVLTIDYELFGNGSGDVFKNIINPMYELLSIAEKYDIKYTIFFEVVEYWKLKAEWMGGNSMGYPDNPAAAMEKQICEAYRQGHDIQLHIHPQWVDAYWENGRWIVDSHNWRLGGYKEGNIQLLYELLRKGKETLEKLLCPVNPNYRCLAIRAGGYNIQPSEGIVTVMKETGLAVDSSIYPGGFEKGNLSDYDYRNINPSKGLWHVNEKLEEEGKSTVVELPIVAFPVMRLRKYLTKEWIGSLMKNRESAKENLNAKMGVAKKGIWKKVRYLFQTEWQTWDFCLFSPSRHNKFLKEIGRYDRDVFVLIGHPKCYSSGRGLNYLLKRTNGEFVFETITEVWNRNR